MVAFHYPPFQGGSGVHRTLKFSRYLPEFGWRPIVLSAHPRAYPQVGEEQLREIAPDVVVERAFALDASRHLSIAGRYSRLTALPDPWSTWCLGAVWSGLRLIRKYQPSVIWSTYPIATAHLIGLMLHRFTGLPWVADFRDSMTEDNYPRDRWSRECYLWIERRIAKHAARLVFTAPSTIRMYRDRYPDLTADRCLLISNGYDEEDFGQVIISKNKGNANGRAVRLLHAGLIYTDDRDPRAFFRAIARLKKAGIINAAKVVIDLRASGSEEYYRKLLNELEICDLVRLLPAIPHHEALQDCADADALLLFQAASCNHQIPAKAYEYLRFGKPVLALTPEQGDTGRLLAEAQGATIVDLADEERICQAFPQFIESVAKCCHPLPNGEFARRYSRKFQTSQVAVVLSGLSPNR
jgi:glycosyltransferase involved in cell wall biosynthesis